MLKTYLCSLQSNHYYSHEQFVTYGPLPDLKFFRSKIFSPYIFSPYSHSNARSLCSLPSTAMRTFLPFVVFSAIALLFNVAGLWTGTCRSLLSVEHSGKYVRTCDIPCIGACLGAFRACWIANLPSDFVGTCTQSSLPKRAQIARISEPPKTTSIPTSLLKRAVRQLFSLE